MSKPIIGLVLWLVLLAPCRGAEAQYATKLPRIGYLSGASASAIASRVEAFRQGLRELGYVEGKNVVIEYRYADRHPDRFR
jgi:putative ABC transport system substrate-binding protein